MKLKLPNASALRFAVKTKAGFRVLDLRKISDRTRASLRVLYMKNIATGKVVRVGRK